MTEVSNKTVEQLLVENEELRIRLDESEEALNAIRNNKVDAIIISTIEGDDRIFSLNSTETPYRVIIEEMNEGAITVSSEGTILYCNRRFATLIGHPLETIVGLNFTSFISDLEKPKFERMLQIDQQLKESNEFTIIQHDQNTIYLKLSFSLLPRETLGDICIIVTDITELKKFQLHLNEMVKERTLELEETNTKLREVNAMKDKLFSIIAHDLRNPFTALLGITELLSENLRSYAVEKVEMMLMHMNSAAKGTLTLLENLLMWARSQNKQFTFVPEVNDINVLIQEAMVNLSPLSLQKDIRIIFNPSTPIIAAVDENMINIILRNLITNAIKFSFPGGTIEIYATNHEKEVEISICDHGLGMSPQTQNSLFHIDHQHTQAGTAQEKGTGLGLILCHEFVHQHGGRIWVNSEISKGSIFKFTIPHRNNDMV